MGVSQTPRRSPIAGAPAPSARNDRGGQRAIPIGALDSPWLRAQSKIALGPLDLPSLSDLRAAFVELAAQGERTRAGFTLSESARRWIFDPHRLSELAEQVVVEQEPATPDINGDEERFASLERLLESTAVENTTAAHFTRAGDSLVFAQNHALGDAHLTLRLPAALVRVARGEGLPNWVDAPHAEHPLWSAVVHSARPGINPFAGLWRDRATSRGGRSAGASSAVPTTEPLPQRSAFRALSPRGWREVKAWRREHAPQASLASLHLVILRQALSSAGIVVTPETVVLYDCRRYLPGRAHVLGNFVVARSQHFGDDPTSVSENLVRTLESARPLATLVAATAKNAIRPPRTRHAPDGPIDNECLPAFVFPPRSPELEAMPWKQPDFRCMAVASGPPRANAINATMHLIGGRLSTSLCYHPAVIADSAIYAALTLIDEHPIALLERARRG